MTTRLQARVDAQDEKIQHLSNEMRSLSSTVHSMQEMLKSFPDSMEKLISTLLTQHGKQPLVFNKDGSVHFETSDSALIPDQSEEQSIGMFLRGLKSEVRNWVKALNPTSCGQAMKLARHMSIATAPPSEKKKPPNLNIKPAGQLRIILLAEGEEMNDDGEACAIETEEVDGALIEDVEIAMGVHGGKRRNVGSNYVHSDMYIGSGGTGLYNQAQRWKLSPREIGLEFNQFNYLVMQPNLPINQHSPTNKSLELEEGKRKEEDVCGEGEICRLKLTLEDEAVVGVKLNKLHEGQIRLWLIAWQKKLILRMLPQGKVRF